MRFSCTKDSCSLRIHGLYCKYKPMKKFLLIINTSWWIDTSWSLLRYSIKLAWLRWLRDNYHDHNSIWFIMYIQYNIYIYFYFFECFCFTITGRRSFMSIRARWWYIAISNCKTTKVSVASLNIHSLHTKSRTPTNCSVLQRSVTSYNVV